MDPPVRGVDEQVTAVVQFVMEPEVDNSSGDLLFGAEICPPRIKVSPGVAADRRRTRAPNNNLGQADRLENLHPGVLLSVED